MNKAAPPKPYNMAEDGVTQSLLGMFFECRKKAGTYLERWSPLKVGQPLLHGILVHRVLETVHETQRKTKKTPGREAVVAVVEAVVKAHEKEEGGRWSAEETEKFETVTAQMLAVLPEYFQYWDRKPLAWVDVEGVFRVPFKFGPNMSNRVSSTWLMGRMDGVYRSSKTKTLWLFDAKNKSQIVEEQLGETLLRDFQINFYLLAVRLLTGEIPAGFLYNVLRRPNLKVGKAESLAQYADRIKEHIKEDPEHYFKRYEVCVTNEDLDQFERELVEVLWEFESWNKAGRPGRMFGQPCISKYGMCANIPICYNDNRASFYQRPSIFRELDE
jgi:hypothetical protein